MPPSPAPVPETALPAEIPDADLLVAWVREQRQADFTELVRRHLGLVRATARRQVGPDLAEDATQMVFAILARKAGSLTGLRSLGAWLHRVTVLQCRSMVRGQIRERRKQDSAMENARLEEARDPLAEALPFLDAAICDLPDKDRELIHLRYSEGLSFTEAARRTGRSEVALRQQASRALGKLQVLLKGRGVAVPVAALAAGLGGMLGGGSTATAASVVAAGALACSATVGGGWLAWMTFLTMTTKQSIGTGVALAVLLAAGPLAWRAHEIHEAGRNVAAAGGASESTAKTVAGKSGPEAGAAPARPGGGAGATVKGSPIADLMKVAELLAGEVKTGLGEWMERSAELQVARTGRALNLSQEKRESLRKLLSDQAAVAVKKGLNFDDDEDEQEDDAAKTRRLEEDKAALEAWYAANLSPEESGALAGLKAKERSAEIRRLTDASVYQISSTIPLSPEQRAELGRAAEARAVAEVDGPAAGRSISMGVNIDTAGGRPLEEMSGDLVEEVLDPAQQELWRLAQQRDRIFQDELPKRVLDRALPVLKEPEVQDALKEIEATPPAEPGH